MDCPFCHNKMEIRAEKDTKQFSCPYCGSRLPREDRNIPDDVLQELAESHIQMASFYMQVDIATRDTAQDDPECESCQSTK